MFFQHQIFYDFPITLFAEFSLKTAHKMERKIDAWGGGHQESISFRWASFWEVLWSFRLVSALCLVHVGSLGAPFSDDVGDFGRLLDHCYSIRHRFGIIFAPNACFLNPWWRPNTILVSLSCSRHPKFQHCGTFPIRAPCLLRKNIDLDTV